MIGFKKTPSKLVLSVFFISLIFVLLIYVDSVLNKPIPEEKITISMSLTEDPPVFKNKVSHEVNKGESLSVIFEEKKVPLNTAYKIFNFDEDNILSSIKPGDLMEFNYIGDDLYSIKIIKDDVNSILIDISEDVSIKKIKKQIQKITSLKQGEIKNSFYMDALRVGIPESIIMDFAYIIDFI